MAKTTTTQDLAERGKEKEDTVRAVLDRMRGQLKLALPRHLTADKMLRTVLTSIRVNPKIGDCTPVSLAACVMQAAQLGLEIGVLGHAYLVPFFNSKRNALECQLIPGYKGLVHLARLSGEVGPISATLVYEKDKWEYQRGTDPKIVHVPTSAPDPGKLVAGYAVAKLRGGETQFEWMWAREIEAIAAGVLARDKYETSPWRNPVFRPEMEKKTVIRRFCKLLPASAEDARRLAAAVALDETSEAGLGTEEIVDLGLATPAEAPDPGIPSAEPPAPDAPPTSEVLPVAPEDPADEREPGPEDEAPAPTPAPRPRGRGRFGRPAPSATVPPVAASPAPAKPTANLF